MSDWHDSYRPVWDARDRWMQTRSPFDKARFDEALAAHSARLDCSSCPPTGVCYCPVTRADSLPAGVVNMSKIEAPKPTSIVDRNALIAAIKKIEPSFEAGDEKSLDYLTGYYSHAANPASPSVFKNGDALNPGPHPAKLDARETMEHTIAARLVQRNRSITAHCQTEEEKAAVINRADAREHEEALRHQERQAGVASSLRLDANSDAISPVVKAQVAYYAKVRSLHRAPSGGGFNGGDAA